MISLKSPFLLYVHLKYVLKQVLSIYRCIAHVSVTILEETDEMIGRIMIERYFLKILFLDEKLMKIVFTRASIILVLVIL